MLFFYAVPTLCVISSVGPLPNTKKLISPLSARYDELLSTLKRTIFLAKSLLTLHEPNPSKNSGKRLELYTIFDFQLIS